MDQDTMANGVMIKLTVKENSSMQMETYMKVGGSMIKPTEKELILMQMELCM